MGKRPFRRFERLENSVSEGLTKENIKISKRFDRLEVGDKKIEVAIIDKIQQKETAPAEITFDIICKDCGAQNSAGARICVLCKHNLEAEPNATSQLELGPLKKCLACGATSVNDRKNCWVCGKEFIAGPQKNISPDTDNVITLDIDGEIYKSTDKKLPPEIKLLIERIRRQGYNKEMIQEWIKKRNSAAEAEKEELSFKAATLKSDIKARRNGLISMLALLAFVVLLMVFILRVYG